MLLVAPAAAAGCGGSNIGGGADTGGAPAVPQARFTRQVSAAEARQVGGAYGVAGTWNLTLGNGVYSLGAPSQPFGGSTSIVRGRISFLPPNIPQLSQPGLSDAQRARIKESFRATLAPCGTTVGSYQASHRGRTQVFKPVKDACTARRIALSRPWTRGR